MTSEFRKKREVLMGDEKTHEPNDVKSKNQKKQVSDVCEIRKNDVFSCTHEPNVIKGIPVSAHRLRWSFKLTSQRPQRPPFKETKMRNWTRRFWTYQRATIISNTKTIELYMKTGRFKNIDRLFSEAWKRARLIMSAFCKWQRITLKINRTIHKEDLEGAHIVLEDKKLTPLLRSQMGKPSSSAIGLTEDSSHSGKAELTGPYSIEGSQGLDYLALRFPTRYRLDQEYLRTTNEELKCLVQAVIEATHLQNKTLAEQNKALQLLVIK